MEDETPDEERAHTERVLVVVGSVGQGTNRCASLSVCRLLFQFRIRLSLDGPLMFLLRYSSDKVYSFPLFWSTCAVASFSLIEANHSCKRSHRLSCATDNNHRPPHHPHRPQESASTSPSLPSPPAHPPPKKQKLMTIPILLSERIFSPCRCRLPRTLEQ